MEILHWHDVIGQEKKQPYFQQILDTVMAERAAGKKIYPAQSEVFNAFRYTPFHKIKAVLLGQDPYHGLNQAHGLCFSVQPMVAIPPSLMNIYKELANDLPNFKIPNCGFLQSWAEQGVLMLNTTLTVQEGKPHSHFHLGWEQFTDNVIAIISKKLHNIIFLLWGSAAQKKQPLIDINKHHVLTAAHPSPFSAHRGFFGCRHFSRTNQLLHEQKYTPIDWQPKMPDGSLA